MNLSELDTTPIANEGAELHVRGPNGAPVYKADGGPVTITLLGEDSEVVTALRARNANRQLKNGIALTVEVGRANELEILVAATVGWDGVGIDEDETLFSAEAARRLYAIPYIRDQVAAFIMDRASFTKASPKA